MNWRIVRTRVIENYRGSTLHVAYREIDPATINFETHVIDEVLVYPFKKNEKRYRLERESDHGVVKSFELKEGGRMVITFENHAPLLIK